MALTSNSVTLQLSLNKTIQKVVSECQNLLNNPQTSILELTRLIGLLRSTIQAVLPARLNCRFLQVQQISSLSENLSYLDKIVLNQNSKIELKWWVQNLELCNGRELIQPPAEVSIQTDASTKAWGDNVQWNLNGGMWSAQEMKNHINVLELLAIKLAIQTFSKTLKHKAIHLQVDNMVALTYLLKMRGSQNLKLVQLTKEIWGHLLQCGITLTAEYLPSKLNVTADWESRNNSDSSEWKLAPQSFQRICQLRGTPEIDLFASRLSHQIKTYVSWRPAPLSQAADAFQQNWFHKSLYAFPPFCMIPNVLSKVRKEKVPMMILVTPAWPSQLWYPEAMRMSMQQPILLTWRRDLLENTQGEIHPLVQNKTLKLVAWTVSGLDYKRKEFQGRLPTSSLNQEDQFLTQIMNQPGVNGLAGVLKEKLIHFVVI